MESWCAVANKKPKIYRALRWKNSRVHVVDADRHTLCEPTNTRSIDLPVEIDLELPLIREYAHEMCITCRGRAMVMGLDLWRSEAETHSVKIDMRAFYWPNNGGDKTETRWQCQEASTASGATYIPCGEDGTKLVLSERGQRIYVMCDACADHNIRNRGAVLLAVHKEMDV